MLNSIIEERTQTDTDSDTDDDTDTKVDVKPLNICTNTSSSVH